ncbi:MAG: hypothetical protein WB347_06110 [Terriglobales bacterium]
MKTKQLNNRRLTPAATGARKRASGKAPIHARIVVTDENVEQLKKKFDTLPKDDPEFDRLGDALHRYMIG